MRLFTVRDRQPIQAPLDRVFALSTSVPVVQRTLGLVPVAGVTKGHIAASSQVLWKGLLFGLPQSHFTVITDFAAPHADAAGNRVAWFQDTQGAGRFAFFQHNHHMLEVDGRTLLQDDIHFALPFGVLGAWVARMVLCPYIRKTLRARMQLLNNLAVTASGDPYLA